MMQMLCHDNICIIKNPHISLDMENYSANQ